MNPPVSKGPLYDLGYSDGYRDRGLEQVVIDLREVKNISEEDWEYLSQICSKFPADYRKVLEKSQ